MADSGDTQWPDLADFDLAEQEPWDRLAGEPTKHYAAFRLYRDMAPVQRTLGGAALQSGMSERRLREVANRWLWRERADAWDDACHQTEDRERLELIRQMHKVHRSAGRLAVGKAMQALQQLIPDDMNPAQIVRMLALGAKLERDTLIVSVEELQGIEDITDDEDDDPWERISRSSPRTTSVTTLATSEPAWGTRRRTQYPTRGALDRQVASLLGWKLFPWQDLVADTAGEYHNGSKVPLYRTVGVSVARQNGKTTLVCSRIARQLIGARQTVAYTAQDRGLARTKWDEHVGILMDTPFADRVDRVDRTNHREMLVMQNGSRYMPVTPNVKKAGRSLSIDLAIIDEAHAHEDLGVVSAIQPAMAARPYAQIWLLSNAGDSRSGLWRHYTDVGRLEVDNPASTMAWFEWAPPEPDKVDQYDRAAWIAANPSMGHPGGVLESALSDGALTMDRSTFFREHLNVWMDSTILQGIDAVTWAACRRDDIVPTQQLAFALDFTPERDRGALAVAGVHTLPNGDTVTPVELIESGSDLERLVSRTAEVANQWNGHIVIDRGSPAASALPALERATWDDSSLTHKVRLIPFTELVRACGDFHDAAVHARISHRGDYRLTDAVTGATKRRVGEAWAWQRRGGADISPLVAVTLARWGVVTAPEELVPTVW